MILKTSARNRTNLHYTTAKLLKRMLSPLCGLDQRLGFTLRSREAPRFMMAGADLTGVHLLRKQPRPKQGSYHLGGGGIFLEEALIRSLGETVERYSQFVSEVSYRDAVVTQTYYEMAKQGNVLPIEKFQFFSDEQYARPGFPFKPFSRDAVLGWVEATSLLSGKKIWVPAQQVLVGYVSKGNLGEVWLSTAVTTGSAAHTKQELALRNALLELIQIDSAMGHWYSSAVAPRIVLDDRTKAVQGIIERQFHKYNCRPKFYWLSNPDLSGMTVVCVIEEKSGRIPSVAVGLGIDLRLEDALYKALLEAVGVAQLAKVVLLDLAIGENTETKINPQAIFDLDLNVAYYALPRHASFIKSKFSDNHIVRALDLPPDSSLSVKEENALLVDGFRNSGKELVFLDLTTDDIRELGFIALRVWSPDTLSLCLPSAPLLKHPRFRSYGGAQHEDPHPYP